MLYVSSVKREALLICVFVALHSMSAHAQAPYFDKALAQRADSYFRAVESHRFDLIWDLSSETVHRDAGGDFDEFDERMTSEPPTQVECKILKVLANGDRGWAWVRIASVSELDGSRDTEVYESSWILKDGEWFFDDMYVSDYDFDDAGEPIPRK